jgi:hypothetical protein
VFQRQRTKLALLLAAWARSRATRLPSGRQKRVPAVDVERSAQPGETAVVGTAPVVTVEVEEDQDPAILAITAVLDSTG